MPLRPRIYFDAAVKASGHAGIGFVAVTPAGAVAHQQSIYIGLATVPAAEYTALIYAAAWAVEQGLSGIDFCGDAQLIVNHLRGLYVVRAAHLRPFHAQAQTLLRAIPEALLHWVPREHNKLADVQSRRELDRVLIAQGMR